MKKLLLCATLAASLTASAEVLTPEQALLRLEESATQLNTPAVRRVTAQNAIVAMPVKTVSSAAGIPQLYLFNDGDNGLVLVSAESEVEPLLGFTDAYTPGTPLPPAMEYMMDCYAAEIEALRNDAVTYSAESTFDLNSPAIAPICTTKWDQGSPYNAMCPTLGGQPTYTGCVATAMAQVLKTYEYPAQCSGGSFSYHWGNNNSLLSMNFNDVVLDWDEMGDKYTASESAPAVAELMKAVAYSAQMGFGTGASGTHSYHMATGLVRNFDYDTTLSHEKREWYPLGQWQQMVYDVLKSGHGVYYDGANPDNTAAHAFVVDGYRGDGLFHLNWGWGGMSDGYFRLTALDPSAQGIGGSTAGYDRGQGAIFNMKPGAVTSADEAPLIFFMITGFKATKSTGKVNSEITFRAPGDGGLYNNGPNTVKKANPAVKFTKSTGEAYWFKSTGYMSNVAPYSGMKCNYSCYISDLTDGTYTVSPAVYNPNTEEYFDVRYPIGMGGKFTAEVSGTSITFSSSVEATLVAEEVSIPDAISQNTPFELTARLTNPGNEDYHGPIYVQLYKPGSSTKTASLGAMVVSAAPGETVSLSAFFKLEGTSVSVGDYEIALLDQNNSPITDRISVTLEEEKPEGTPSCQSLRVTNKKQDQLTFRMSLKCTGGDYINSVYVVITEYGKNQVLTYFASPIVQLKSGASAKSVDIVCDFADGVPGARYKAYPYYNYRNQGLVQMGGSSVAFYLEEATAIEEIEDNTTAPVEYFDLEGRRVNEPQNGIFIRKQGSSVSKVIL